MYSRAFVHARECCSVAENIMKKFLSLFISFVILFNLTADIFAQQIGFNTNKKPSFGLTNDFTKRMQEEQEELKAYMNAVDKRAKNPAMYKNEPPGLAKLEAQMEIMDKKLEKLIIESVPQNEREVAAKLGANFYQFKDALRDQEDVDLGASWRAYCKELTAYNTEYITLARKFDLYRLTYLEIASKMTFALRNNQNGKTKYDDKEYSTEAFLHAAVHNLVTRKTSGYIQKSPWVFGSDSNEEFSIEQKISVMDVIYTTVAKYGYYPDDRRYIWDFAYDIVKNGKKYFDNDTYKADILPGLANADDRIKRDHGKSDRNRQANFVSQAMAILPILSETETEKEQAAQAIYELMKDTMSDDYASISILTGARALIAIDTSESSIKLLNFLINDCKKSFVKGYFEFLMGLFSLESWAKAVSRAGDAIKNGGGYSYNNALTLKFTYIDKNRTDSNTRFMAEGSAMEGYYNAIYTNIFEEIGRELGSHSASENELATSFAIRLSNTGFNANFSDDDLTASIVVGILDTAIAGESSLNRAAYLIYEGNWWDLNEATQRSKNNIAAAYLGKPKKEYNKEKDEIFKTMLAGQDTAKYMDIAVNAVMLSTMIVSAPAILKSIAKFPGKIINRIQTIGGQVRNVRLSTSPKVGISPEPIRSSFVPTASKAPATTAPKATTTAPKTAMLQTAPKVATTATNAEKGAATATVSKPAPSAEEISATNKAQLKSECGTLDLPSLTQFINRNPAVRALFNSSRSKVMKLAETEGFSVEKAKTLFMEDFAKGLTESSLVPATQRANILETVAKELGVAYDAKPQKYQNFENLLAEPAVVENTGNKTLPQTLTEQTRKSLINFSKIFKPETYKKMFSKASAKSPKKASTNSEVITKFKNNSRKSSNIESENSIPKSITDNKWTSTEHKKLYELRQNLKQKKAERKTELNRLDDIISDPNGINVYGRDAKIKKLAEINTEIIEIEKEIAELEKKIPPVKMADGRYNVKIDDITSFKEKDFSQNKKIQQLMKNSNISPVDMDVDIWEIYNTYIRGKGNNLKFNSKEQANLFIRRKSNGKFKTIESLNKALTSEHPLYQDAIDFITGDPAFKNLELVISSKTPGYATLNMNMELRIPLDKLIANFSGSIENINIKLLKDGLFTLEFKHTHNVRLDQLFEKFCKGDVLAVMRKSDNELLIVYDRIKNNEYIIGIIQENPGRGVNLLTTNYTVKTDVKGLGEQFFTYSEDKTAGIRTITDFNEGEILYLKQPTATNYNQNAVNRFLSDISDLRNNTKIGTEYYMYQP